MDIYKRQDFSKDELSLIFNAFKNKIITRPQRGDIYTGNSWDIPGGMSFDISFRFHKTFTEEIQQALQESQFSSRDISNWNRILNKLLNATVNMGKWGDESDYFLKCQPYWD